MTFDMDSVWSVPGLFVSCECHDVMYSVEFSRCGAGADVKRGGIRRCRRLCDIRLGGLPGSPSGIRH
jgi:hypothetical protein